MNQIPWQYALFGAAVTWVLVDSKAMKLSADKQLWAVPAGGIAFALLMNRLVAKPTMPPQG